MARKKSIGGRSRGLSITSVLLREIKNANRALVRLDKEREYGTYASRRLLNELAANKKLKYNRKSKNRFKLKDVRELNTNEQRLMLKEFQRFNKSKANTPEGIKKAEEEIISKVTKGLTRKLDRQITRRDAEDFWDMFNDPDYKYFTDKIGGSTEVFELIENARINGLDELGFIESLEQYMTMNNEDVRNKAIRLYDKYVK